MSIFRCSPCGHWSNYKVTPGPIQEMTCDNCGERDSFRRVQSTPPNKATLAERVTDLEKEMRIFREIVTAKLGK